MMGHPEGGKYGDGTVFEIASGSHQVTTVASLDGANGRFPFDGVIADRDDNLYGTTQYGGAFDQGAIFKVAAGTHALTTLASFDGTNGRFPYARLFADAHHNLYGTTGSYDGGTVFELEAGSGALDTLATFDGPNGLKPTSDLIADAKGNLYGTTYFGGAYDHGTLFEIAAGTHALTTLVSFNGTNGAYPVSGLVADAQGNLYGTTVEGGSNDYGTVFQLAAETHVLTTLLSFDFAIGYYPQADLIIDSQHNLYGTTWLGGRYDRGTVFRLSPIVPEPTSINLLIVAVLLPCGVISGRWAWPRGQAC